MNGKTTVILAVVVLALGGYLLFRNGGTVEPSTSPSPSTSPLPSASPTVSPSASASPEGALKVFAVTGTSFSFNVKEMRVKKGDRVQVVFTNVAGMHDWVLDEFKAKTPVLQVNGTATVEFVADKTGTFEYYCSVGNHRAQGMVGKLIVE